MNSKFLILLVEDNEKIMEVNRRLLELHGYTVETAMNLQQAQARVKRRVPDALVLDIMLPDGSGLAFCEELRGNSGVPILFLSALGEDADVVAGLRAGGDDYLAKPYSLEVLVARIEALLRRFERQHPAPRGKLGNLVLDPASRRAYCEDADLLLTAKEFAILEMLLTNCDRFLPAAALYETAWGLDANEDVNAVKTHISRLRGKLEAAGCTMAIVSGRGKGYRLVEAAREEVKPKGEK
ncbi:response regulator transcription factor [Christensenellaceae bacterium OttesenSCG-928-M15]|nr:response regulator transcription factor [Christensenellaceae bacterium OttesenSCG-928-M15]